MCSQIILSAHAPADIAKPHKVGLRCTVLEARVCFGILNGTKGQKRKSTIRGIEMSLNTFFDGF